MVFDDNIRCQDFIFINIGLYNKTNEFIKTICQENTPTHTHI